MEKTVTLKQYRALADDARAALRMIREVVEQHAPPGSVPSEEMVEPPFVKEAEVLVKGILAIAEARCISTTAPTSAQTAAHKKKAPPCGWKRLFYVTHSVRAISSRAIAYAPHLDFFLRHVVQSIDMH